MKPTDPPRCEKCDIAKPFTAHWCCYAGRGCPETNKSEPTQEIRNIIEGKAYNE